MNNIHRSLIITAALALLGAGCAPASDQASPTAAGNNGPFSISSPVFAEGQPIPATYTCEGTDFSPGVEFANIPKNAKSLVLIMEDQDAPVVHWVLYDIPPNTVRIQEGDIPAGLVGQGTNGRMGYEGPCPPKGETHSYTFTLYALDTVLGLPDGSLKDDVTKAIEGHIVGTAALKGTYEKK